MPWPSTRALAASAAVAVAVSGRGDLLLLGALLVVALAEWRASIAALLAVVAVAARWGTTSAETVAGAAAAFGPGLRVGPPLAAAALGLAAGGLLLSGVGAPLLSRLAAGVTAGVVVGGPVGGSSAQAIVIGLLAASAGAVLAASLPRLVPEAPDRLRGAAPVVAGAAVLVAVVW